MFLEGCGLPQAWAGRRSFTVAELGFGTGLNIVALLDLWRRTREPSARLSIFSLEASPLSREDAARALGRWPELSEVTEALLRRWPGRATGFHRVDLPQFGATLDLAVMDAEAALAGWNGAADAWFLDGFSPSLNPAMWSEAVFEQIASRSLPGARAATFTVAGAVRRGLERVGFSLDRRPGFGRKRERLEATWPGPAPRDAPPQRVAIVGGGIAAASLMRAFEALGTLPEGFDPRGAGGGASGNPSALVTPRLDAGLGPAARLFAQAFSRAVTLYEAEAAAAIIAKGALQLAVKPNDARRFATIAAADLFEAGTLRPLEANEATTALGEAAAGGLWLTNALTVEPLPVLAALGAAPARLTISSLRASDGGWDLLGADGVVVGQADIVVVAAGPETAALTGMPTSPVRGQVSWSDLAAAKVPAAFGGYAIPTREGVLFGATHDRDDSDETVRTADEARNLELLAKGVPGLAERLATVPLKSRASLRAATPDRLPIAGLVPERPGLFVLSGLGARGYCLAPLLAEHIAALALGRPSPLPADLAALVEPGRFAARASRRARDRGLP